MQQGSLCSETVGSVAEGARQMAHMMTSAEGRLHCAHARTRRITAAPPHLHLPPSLSPPASGAPHQGFCVDLFIYLSII